MPAPGFSAVRACGFVPLAGGFPPVGPTAAPSGGGSSPRPAQRPAPQQQPEAVEVEGQHREGDDAGKAVRAVGPHPVKAAVLEVVDRRLDRWMLPARRGERRIRFAGVVGPAQAPLARQDVVLEQGVEAEPVRRVSVPDENSPIAPK